MKRGTPDHPKAAMLATTLDVPLYAALGLLECLFHLTAQYARRGDIGRYSNRIIADRCFWDGDPDTLIAALIECRWLDEHPEHRLVLHDWNVHADNTVRTALLRAKESFWNGAPPRKPRNDDSHDDDATVSQHRCDTVATFLAKPSQAKPSIHSPSYGEQSVEAVPTLKDVQAYAAPVGLTPAEAENFHSYYETRGWVTTSGQPIRSWQAALRRWKVTAQERASLGRSSGGRERHAIRPDYNDPADPLLGTKASAGT